MMYNLEVVSSILPGEYAARSVVRTHISFYTFDDIFYFVYLLLYGLVVHSYSLWGCNFMIHFHFESGLYRFTMGIYSPLIRENIRFVVFWYLYLYLYLYVVCCYSFMSVILYCILYCMLYCLYCILYLYVVLSCMSILRINQQSC